MNFPHKLLGTQEYLAKHQLDGWLLYDFRHQNPLAVSFLGIPKSLMLTRRFFYWIPIEGEPIKLVHAIEERNLDHLPGERKVYSTWKQMQETIQMLLYGKKKILMEYSKNNAVPYLSKVDAGTIEFVRSCGVEVESSGDLLQHYTSVWSEPKYADHQEAARVLSQAVSNAWQWIGSQIQSGNPVNEYQVQELILKEIENNGCETEEPPIVAVNAHSANPHYLPNQEKFEQIRQGDFLLIDLYCRKKKTGAPYADITRVAVVADQPEPRHNEIFEIVRSAQAKALELVKERFQIGEQLKGWEVDKVCRDVIEEAGYGKFFIHRTGHNLDAELHGPGANIDNFETCDDRQILPGTCFTIEPGIYLPGEFGVRLEYDVFIHQDGKVEVNGGVQSEIECLL